LATAAKAAAPRVSVTWSVLVGIVLATRAHARGRDPIRPTREISQISAHAYLQDAANDYSGQYDRYINPETYKPDDPELYTALETWIGRPRIFRGGRSALKGRKVPPKYRSPSGETWAGRGARPRWLVEALKKGKKLENFLIDKSGHKGRRKRRSKR